MAYAAECMWCDGLFCYCIGWENKAWSPLRASHRCHLVNLIFTNKYGYMWRWKARFQTAIYAYIRNACTLTLCLNELCSIFCCCWWSELITSDGNNGMLMSLPLFGHTHNAQLWLGSKQLTSIDYRPMEHIVAFLPMQLLHYRGNEYISFMLNSYAFRCNRNDNVEWQFCEYMEWMRLMNVWQWMRSMAEQVADAMKTRTKI